MIRNFIRQSQPWTKNITPVLGRWNRNDNIDRKVDLANIDHCGDRVCGDLYEKMKPMVELFDKRWNQEITKEEFREKIKQCEKKDNIDSSFKNNYNYSIESIVEDYNTRWNKNLTIEEYLKEFTRLHRGAC
jgi:hypothetical protein